MAWTGHAVGPRGGRTLPKQALVDFREIGIPRGLLMGSDVAAALERIGMASAYTKLDSASIKEIDKVADLLDIALDEPSYAHTKARGFLRICAKHGLGFDATY